MIITKMIHLNSENTRPVLFAVASSRSRSFALVRPTTTKNRPTTSPADAPILKSIHKEILQLIKMKIQDKYLTLSAMAPWDLIGGAQTFKNIKNLSKSSFDHGILHLPPIFI